LGLLLKFSEHWSKSTIAKSGHTEWQANGRGGDAGAVGLQGPKIWLNFFLLLFTGFLFDQLTSVIANLKEAKKWKR
jgi:hypothetical protein